VPGAKVEIAGSTITTDAAGRATFRAPVEAGTFGVRLENGASFGVVVLPAPSASSANVGRAHFVSPGVIAVNDRLVLEGIGFSGEAAKNRVLLGEHTALVLASSPVSLVALPNPRTAIGAGELRVAVEGHDLGAMPVQVVSLSVTGPAKPLAAGKKDVLRVEVSGTPERVGVEVINLSPEVLQLPRGTAVQFTTSGGTPNFFAIEVTGVKPGEYSVSARIVAGSVPPRR
jgi:hypothetical protein